jgi:hypothetical protein
MRDIREGRPRNAVAFATEGGESMGKRIAILGLAVMGALAGACDKGGSSVSCGDAMDNLYDEGCAISYGGTLVSEADAVTGCADERDLAKEAGCLAEFKATLGCMNDLADGDCAGCDGDWGDYNSCMGY